jgi:hypothetical protein
MIDVVPYSKCKMTYLAGIVGCFILRPNFAILE